mmetsp:Transcript_57700/g.172165  ORF Transcript_57700/g.172165 Transcript_57700/m.172165 type:complete len:381 (-) Transcript_57700:401-1543(-)
MNSDTIPTNPLSSLRTVPARITAAISTSSPSDPPEEKRPYRRSIDFRTSSSSLPAPSSLALAVSSLALPLPVSEPAAATERGGGTGMNGGLDSIRSNFPPPWPRPRSVSPRSAPPPIPASPPSPFSPTSTTLPHIKSARMTITLSPTPFSAALNLANLTARGFTSTQTAAASGVTSDSATREAIAWTPDPEHRSRTRRGRRRRCCPLSSSASELPAKWSDRGRCWTRARESGPMYMTAPSSSVPTVVRERTEGWQSVTKIIASVLPLMSDPPLSITSTSRGKMCTYGTTRFGSSSQGNANPSLSNSCTVPSPPTRCSDRVDLGTEKPSRNSAARHLRDFSAAAPSVAADSESPSTFRSPSSSSSRFKGDVRPIPAEAALK